MSASELELLGSSTLLAQTGLLVAASDEQGRIALLSPGMQELFELPFEALDETEFTDRFRLFTHDGSTPLPTADIPLVRARRGERVRDALIATQSRAGRLLFLRCNASPLVGPDGAINGAIVLVQDVTGERAAHERQAELRDRLLETVNHHLRTPVTKLLGYAEVLADTRDAVPPEARRAVAAILGAAEELGTLLETVSALSDLDRHTVLTKTYGDLSIALGQVARTLRPVFDTRDVRLEVDVPDRLSVVLDFAEVRNAIGALLANAARYAPSGSVVVLGARADGTLGVEITVSDLGPGIDEADRDRLVRPFERGAHPDQDVTGKGMGLAVAHTVAGAHGGALRLESNDPHGLRATLLIPSPSFD